MKKYFIFAAIATAGLFASCSSSDDITSSDVQNPIEDADARQAIRLNLATPTMTTRGTGTVGGVGTGTETNTHYSTNVWAGQTINVFMFNKGDATAAVLYANVDEYNADHDPDIDAAAFAALTTEQKTKTPASAGGTTLNLTEAHDPTAAANSAPVYLYDNQKMITPGSAENLIPGMDASLAKGEAMIEDGTINYYPPKGNFDFFGYHADDAVTGAVDKTTAATSLWTVPFTINGTQDLMSTKAALTGDENTSGTQAYIMANATNHTTDYYSAYAARKEVHPTLTFKHLLTRLQFSVIAGNKSAAGYVAGTPADYYTQAECDTHNAGLENALAAIDNASFYTFTGCLTNEVDNPSWTTNGTIQTVKTQEESSTTYTIVQVLQNNNSSNTDINHEGMVGKYFAVAATALTANTAYELHAVTKNGDNYSITTTASGISAKDIAETTLAAATACINAYNATLSGAWTTATVKTAAQESHLDASQAVKVKKIEVLSANTKGKLAVAWTADNMTDPDKITWDADQGLDATRWLTLMDRPEYKKKDGAAAAAVADFTDLTARNTALTNQKTALQAEKTALEGATTPDQTAIAAKQAEITAVDALITALTDSATNREADMITAETYALLTAAAQTAKYEAIDNPKNEKLIDLTPTSPTGTLSGETFTPSATPTPVGESIILSPGAYDANGVAQTGTAATDKITMKVTLAQNVPTNWNHPTFLTEKTQQYELDITAPAGGFKQNTSYNIKLTVYGLERIVVIAEVEPWIDGGEIPVGQD